MISSRKSGIPRGFWCRLDMRRGIWGLVEVTVVGVWMASELDDGSSLKKARLKIIRYDDKGKKLAG
jgi:hypothetical protein